MKVIRKELLKAGDQLTKEVLRHHPCEGMRDAGLISATLLTTPKPPSGHDNCNRPTLDRHLARDAPYAYPIKAGY